MRFVFGLRQRFTDGEDDISGGRAWTTPESPGVRHTIRQDDLHPENAMAGFSLRLRSKIVRNGRRGTTATAW